MPKRQIVIDLYDHTTDEEIAEIIDAMRGIGIDGARVVVARCPKCRMLAHAPDRFCNTKVGAAR